MIKNKLIVLFVTVLSIIAIFNIGHAAIREFVVIDKAIPGTWTK